MHLVFSDKNNNNNNNYFKIKNLIHFKSSSKSSRAIFIFFDSQIISKFLSKSFFLFFNLPTGFKVSVDDKVELLTVDGSKALSSKSANEGPMVLKVEFWREF